MKLVSFKVCPASGGIERIGHLSASGMYVDLTAATEVWLLARGVDSRAACGLANSTVPPNMVRLIAQSPFALEVATEASEWAMESGAERTPCGDSLIHDPASVELLPVVTDPPMIRDFMSFEKHLQNIFPKLGRQIPAAWYELPVYYKGNTASLGAAGQDIAMPEYGSKGDFDFEFEIAVILQRGGTDISEAEAADFIFGYTIYNDFSARAIQQLEMSVGLGPAKGKDFHNAHVLGPYITTADEIEDVYDLRMEATVNGESWATGSTGDMHWTFEKMIAHASWNELVRAGEVFGSGTMGDGSAMERGLSLGDGDVVELHVEGLGSLRNRVVVGNPASQR